MPRQSDAQECADSGTKDKTSTGMLNIQSIHLYGVPESARRRKNPMKNNDFTAKLESGIVNMAFSESGGVAVSLPAPNPGAAASK